MNNYGFSGNDGFNGNGNGNMQQQQKQRQQQNGQAQRNNMGQMMIQRQEGNMRPALVGGQSLDDIVSQNAKVIRRQSQYGQNGAGNGDMDMGRISGMMEFGGSPTGPLGNYQFDPSSNLDQTGLMGSNTTQSQSQQRSNQSRRTSSDLNLNTNFGTASQGYNTMMPSGNSAYASPAQAQGLDMGMESPYIDSSMGMNMDFNTDQGMGNAMGNDSMNMPLYNQPQFNQGMMSSPMHPNTEGGTPNAGRGTMQDPGGGDMNSQFGNSGGSSTNTIRGLSRSHSMNMPDPGSAGNTPQHQQLSAQAKSTSNPYAHTGFQRQPQYPQPGSMHDKGMHQPRQNFDGINGPLPGVNPSNYNPNNQGFPWETPEGGWPSTMVGRPHMNSVYKNAYSSTGFDMLGVLMRVATRPNPEINIGSVDLSCAFVVCDAEKDDFPIVYCSDNFERLTGYTKHMILGRNCRFLQSPDGNVEPGVRRKYVDDDSVLYLKNMINMRREAQISLINYRRGGQPFMNLLTMIPISWDTDQVKFFVGFQVDLVEQPNAVTNKNPDGSYSINYQRGMTMPRYVMNAPEQVTKAELGQTVPRDDVSTILTTIGTGESEYAKRMWDKVLLENTDDVVHVLSLKGLFQWVSPSALKVLEYEPAEIIGTALSSICHPSDIVPVTRELKDTSTGASVNVVFRIRRKHSGYMWFEGHGSLHTEQGKGRKSIILVGRERPVYALSKSDIVNAGGVGENELWTKMSTSGMFLFVASNVRQLLDRQPDELVGVSIQSLMRTDSKAEFGRILEHARTGKKASVKHEMINRRGQVLSAFTTLYPGDATEGLKPTFIVAQTRLIKFSRGTQPTRPAIYPKNERNSSESMQSGQQPLSASGTPNPAGGASNSNSGNNMSGEQTPNSTLTSPNNYLGTNGAAITYAGQNGLVIGHQDQSLASEDNLFDELKTTKSSSWQYEIRQLEKRNRMLAEEVQNLIAAKKKRKRRKGAGNSQKDCANCHTRVTPEWRRGPSGQRDLCNSCGLRWAKLNGRVSPRTSSQQSVHSAASRASGDSKHSPLHQSMTHSRDNTTTSHQNSSNNNAASGRTPGQTAAPGDKTPGQLKSESPSVPPAVFGSVEPRGQQVVARGREGSAGASSGGPSVSPAPGLLHGNGREDKVVSSGNNVGMGMGTGAKSQRVGDGGHAASMEGAAGVPASIEEEGGDEDGADGEGG